MLRNTELAIEQNRLKLKSDLIEIDYEITRLTRLVSRYEELQGQQFISKNEYEDAVDELEYFRSRRAVTRESQAQDEVIRLAQIEQLESSVEQLEKNLKLARSNLDNLLIRAPRSGGVAQRFSDASRPSRNARSASFRVSSSVRRVARSSTRCCAGRCTSRSRRLLSAPCWVSFR